MDKGPRVQAGTLGRLKSTPIFEGSGECRFLSEESKCRGGLHVCMFSLIKITPDKLDGRNRIRLSPCTFV